MTMEEKIASLVEAEWEAFDKVQNEGGRAPCQDDRATFFIMRRSQYAVWPEELIDSYAADFRAARGAGRNLLSEKYAWMMERTDPERFSELEHLLTRPSRRSLELIDSIAEAHLRWSEDFRAEYPKLAGRSRPLRSSGDGPFGLSVETYLRGELHTYSEATLELYLGFINSLRASGLSLVRMTTEATVREYGFASLDEAEAGLK